MTYKAYLPQFLQPKRIDSLIRIGRPNDGDYVVDSRSVENSDRLIGLASEVGEELVSALPRDLDMPNNKHKEHYQSVFYGHSIPMASQV